MKVITTDSGKKAEHESALALKKLNYKILEMGWRRIDCEIDIVAQNLKTKRLHMFEVKYRKNRLQGDGLDYITKNKQKQMHFAANRYMSENSLRLGYELGAVSVYGPDFRVETVIEQIDL